MKAIQFLGMTAFMAAMLTGCSNDSELAHSNFPADNIIRVTARSKRCRNTCRDAGNRVGQ